MSTRVHRTSTRPQEHEHQEVTNHQPPPFPWLGPGPSREMDLPTVHHVHESSGRHAWPRYQGTHSLSTEIRLDCLMGFGGLVWTMSISRPHVSTTWEHYWAIELCSWDLLQEIALFITSSQATISQNIKRRLPTSLETSALQNHHWKQPAGYSLPSASWWGVPQIGSDWTQHCFRRAWRDQSKWNLPLTLTYPMWSLGERASSRGCQTHQPWSLRDWLSRLCKSVMNCILYAHMDILPTLKREREGELACNWEC